MGMQTQLQPAYDYIETEGVKIPYDPLIITPAILRAIKLGYFEAEEAAQIPHIVEAEDVVLDIGAGIGFISTLIARHAKKVISVEANPDLMPFMAELHRCNGVKNVERLNVVLGNPGLGEAEFYQRKDFWMGSLSAAPNAYVSTVMVPEMSLNQLLEQARVTMVVCDIEGAEAALFNEVNFGDVTRVYLELHDHITGLKGVAAVFSAMAERGFAYDPRFSSGAIILFRKIESAETLRPYAREQLWDSTEL